MITKITALLKLSLICYLLVASAPAVAQQAHEEYSDESDQIRIEIIEKGFRASPEFPLIYMPPTENAEQATKEVEELIDKAIDSL